MKIFDYIIPRYFFGSLLIGIIVAMIYKPSDTVVTKHPTPFNLDTIYKHGNGDCYKYRADKTNCTSDAVRFKMTD